MNNSGEQFPAACVLRCLRERTKVMGKIAPWLYDKVPVIELYPKKQMAVDGLLEICGVYSFNE
ncbi:MAG: hypothetical protein WC560_10445 [Syntrophales bacterium]